MMAVLIMSGLGLGACSVGDPWQGCPENRQCLSGDVVEDSAKFCCGSGETCVSEDTDGGVCVAVE